MTKITINGISIEPEEQTPALAFAGFNVEDSVDSNYILIQTNQPLNRTQKEELVGLGVEIMEYVPDNTYICHYLPIDLQPIRALSYITWANVYLKDFKVNPELRSSSGELTDQNLLALGEIDTSMSHETKQVEVVFHNNVSPNEIQDRLAAAANLSPSDIEISGNSVRLHVRPEHLDKLADIDEVRHIETYNEPTFLNNVAARIIRAEQTNLQCNLQGEGQIVAVCDTGFDKGSTQDVHPAFSGRVLKLYSLGRPDRVEVRDGQIQRIPGNANDPNGHGTHVAGSVLADGKSEAIGGYVRGTAPKAQLIMQSILDRQGRPGGLPLDLTTLFQQPYDDGVRVHNNSWGTNGSKGEYTTQSWQVDQFVYKYRDMVICFAAGNEGADRGRTGSIELGSMTAPGTAKNCITVGASENLRPDFSKRYGEIWPKSYPVDPIASDSWANNVEGIAPFSGRGPAKDDQRGRYKPDLVAPGTSILSTLSRDASIGPFWGKSEDQLYAFDGGTSMATPLVAGCAAVVREYFQKICNHQPSAALVKAMLINGAKPLLGKYNPPETSGIPDFSQGFGRVDLAATVGPFADNEQVNFKDESTELDTEEEEVTEISITSANQILKVTLVWTDPPGKALQNDLDLIVRAGGQERHGNIDPSSMEFDRQNNVEQVIWENVPNGKVDILVRAYRVTGVPQSYALVWRIG
ncbi:MAG: S8 family serine peptidase [Scytonema sp. PMC 1069.18]|nr:S8 family serine peptidase [Scytonema sp. PMC 1069.18]MEC4881532.1 S8 family serine peptidase [Scytonema sp. PMC 1070.18]